MCLTDIYLVRHGHPQLGTGIAYDRAPGPPLSEIGRAEAQLAGLYLASRNVQRLYTSPVERALSTAHAISTETGLESVVEEALAEHRREETFDAVKIRAQDFLNCLHAQPETVVALVSHGSPIKALLQVLSAGQLDLSRHVYANGNHVPTAGIWHARRVTDGWAFDLVFRPVVSTPATHVPV